MYLSLCSKDEEGNRNPLKDKLLSDLLSGHDEYEQSRKALAQRRSNGVAEESATETPNPLADVERMAEEESDFITTLDMIAELGDQIDEILKKSTLTGTGILLGDESTKRDQDARDRSWDKASRDALERLGNNKSALYARLQNEVDGVDPAVLNGAQVRHMPRNVKAEYGMEI